MRIRYYTRQPPPSQRLSGKVPWEQLSWSVVNIGVGIMIGLVVAAFALTRPDADPGPDVVPAALPPTAAPVVGREPFQPPDTTDEGTPAPAAPAASTGPGYPASPSRRNSDGQHTTDPDAPGPDAPGPPPAPKPPAPEPPAVTPTVTGRYQLLNSYGDSFIGEVLLTNVTSTSRLWTVTLRFPSNVGSLRTAWVEGAPQAILRWSGRTAIFTSTANLGPGSSVPLRFHFDRSGSDARPEVCTANDIRCS